MLYVLIGLAVTVVIVLLVNFKQEKKSDSIAKVVMDQDKILEIANKLEFESNILQAAEKVKKVTKKPAAKKAVKAKPTKSSAAKKTAKKKSSSK